MPFKSEKQRKWMWANNPEMAKKWEKEESLTKESGILYKAGVKKYGKEGMKKIQQAAGKRKSHAEIGKIKDKYEKGKKESVSVNEMPNFDRGTSGLPRGWIEDYNKIVKKLSKGKGWGTLSGSDKKKVWATLGKKYNESVKESDLPITTKKQKVIQVKHKTSGKELIVVDTPKWRKKYKQMGFVVQESVNEGGMGILDKDQTDVLHGIVAKNKSKNSKVILSIAMKDRMFKGIDKKELLGYIEGAKQFVKYMSMGRTGNESVNEANVIQKIDKLAKRNKYGTVDGTQMNGKTAREIMAIFKHPKMNSYRNQMLKMKVDDLVDLSWKLAKPLKIKVESVNELTTAQKHQVKIAKDTLKMPKPMRGVMGMSKKEALKILKKYKIKESVNEAERDYKDEYKKFQSSTKAKKYRAELNKYNRKKGTYGNGDGKDATHKGGKISGFEKESINRGRKEKSRLKKEDVMPDFEPMVGEIVDSVIKEYSINEDLTKLRALYAQLNKEFKKYDHKKISDFNKVDKYLKSKFKKGSSLPDIVASFYNDYRGGEEMGKNHKRLFKYAKKMQGESVNEGDKRQYRDAYGKYYKTYEAFAREVMNIAKSASKISGNKTDEKIILKNFKKQVIPFAGLMSSWSKGRESNPHIDEGLLSEKMDPEQYHRYMQYVFDTQFKTPEEKKMKKSIIKKINVAQKKKGLPVFKEGSCGYGIDGEVGDEPAGPHLLKKKKKNESINEAATNIKRVELILKKRQAMKIDGYLVDMQTANVIMKVWKALSSSNKKKFAPLSIKKMAEVAWKLVR